jgi:hypothetical protein
MDKLPFAPYDFFGHLAPGLLFVVGMEWTLGYPLVLHRELHTFTIAVLILLVYVAGVVIAGPAEVVFQQWIAYKWLGRPSINLMKAKPPKRCRLRRWLGALWFAGYREPLPEATQQRIIARAKEAGVTETGEPLFLLIRFHEGCLKNERLMKKLDERLGAYGFARNLAFVCFVVALALLIKVWCGHGAPKDLTRALLLTLGGSLLFYRFLKMLRLYTFELFNVFGSFKDEKGLS